MIFLPIPSGSRHPYTRHFPCKLELANGKKCLLGILWKLLDQHLQAGAVPDDMTRNKQGQSLTSNLTHLSSC